MAHRPHLLDRLLHDEALPRPAGTGRRVYASTGGHPQDRNMARGQHPESSAPRPARPPRELVGVRVVIVDDDADTVEYFAVALTACGAAVTTAATAINALRLTR